MDVLLLLLTSGARGEQHPCFRDQLTTADMQQHEIPPRLSVLSEDV